jgi:hypothetical protein
MATSSAAAGTNQVRADNIKAKSWVDPTRENHLIGQIFFVTDKSNLDDADMAELEKIVSAYPFRLNTRNVPFQYRGHADYRHTKEHNQNLSEQRAQAVANYVGDPARLGGYPNYGANVIGMGVDWRSKHFPPDSATLSIYRRVDIYAPPAKRDPPPPQKDPAPPLPKSSQWRCQLLGGAGGGAGAAIEAFRVDITDLTNKLHMHFWYRGTGMGVGPEWAPTSGSGSSNAVDFSTSVPVTIKDFEGFAHHAAAQFQLIAGPSVDWLTILGPMANCDADLIDLKFTSGITDTGTNLGIGGVATVGTLAPTQKTPWPL